MQKQKYNVTGMTCASCQSHVEKAVCKLSGVQKVDVNLLSNSMVVEYDENIVNESSIIHAVEGAGYGASVVDAKKLDTKNKPKNVAEEEIKSMKKRLIISICFLIPLMYLAMHHMFYEWFGLPVPSFIQSAFHGNENAIAFSLTQVLLLLPIVYVNRNYFINGFKRLLKLSPNMDSLIAMGSSASIIYGIFAIYKIGYGLGRGDMDLVSRYSMDLYFESAGMILTLITLGKFLETKSKGKTNDAIAKLMDLAPKTATVIKDGKEVEVAVEEIQKDDVILLKPGGRIPVDGVVIEGNSSIDQSAITGESIPVEKVVGDSVISGTINKTGSFKMKATKVGEDTTLSQIIKIVEEAGNSKAPISKLADKVAGVFVPIVIGIALLSTIIWLLVGQSLEFSLSMGIAVLVISCPCALGLATPVAIMVGTGKGAEYGILIKSAESLERLHEVDTVVLDKTGTITEGKPKVTKVLSQIEEKELLQIAGSLEKNSEHPLAEAVLDEVVQRQIELVEVSDFEAIAGKGVKAKMQGANYYGGNASLMKEHGVDISKFQEKALKLLQKGQTLLYFAKEKRAFRYYCSC